MIVMNDEQPAPKCSVLCVHVHRLRLRLQVLLDENDPMWIELRHQHIAIVSSQLPQRFKTFSKVSLSLSLTHTHTLSLSLGPWVCSECKKRYLYCAVKTT